MIVSSDDDSSSFLGSTGNNDSTSRSATQVPDDTGIIGATQQDLLGATVVDRLSGQRAEVVGRDSATGQYRIEFLSDARTDGFSETEVWAKRNPHAGMDEPTEPFEAGHSAWRNAAELLPLDIGE